MLPPEMFESAVNNMLQNAPNTKSVERYVAICDDCFKKENGKSGGLRRMAEPFLVQADAV